MILKKNWMKTLLSVPLCVLIIAWQTEVLKFWESYKTLNKSEKNANTFLKTRNNSYKRFLIIFKYIIELN